MIPGEKSWWFVVVQNLSVIFWGMFVAEGEIGVRPTRALFPRWFFLVGFRSFVKHTLIFNLLRCITNCFYKNQWCVNHLWNMKCWYNNYPLSMHIIWLIGSGNWKVYQFKILIYPVKTNKGSLRKWYLLSTQLLHAVHHNNCIKIM
jgi:hypothetical protein